LSTDIFISFIGIDGSGKSTLAKIVSENLLKKDKKIKITYGRFIPVFSRFVMFIGRKFFMKKNNDMYENYEQYQTNKKITMQKRTILTKIYFSLIVAEYLFEVFFKIIIPRKLGYSIIADRYVYDTIINDISLDLGISIDETNRIINKFFRFLPKPDITFLVDVDEKLAFSRKNDIPSISYLEERKKHYVGLDFNEIFKVDGSCEIETLEKIVMKKINDFTSN
tara:strand:+ start:214 stop:882 length:669 start_codon:yes stop_codon:yes gene_type:complete